MWAILACMDEELALPKSRPREVELDILLSHEFASGSPAAEVIWGILGRASPSAVHVERQVERRSDARTSDVVVTDLDSGVQVHCEDKLAMGFEMPNQFKGLAAEVIANPNVVAALVVAPTSFFDRKVIPEPLIRIEVELLAQALEVAAANPREGETPQLQRSYKFRAERFRELCARPVAKLSELGVAFRNAYNDVLVDEDEGRVLLEDGTLTAGGTFAAFKVHHPCPPGFDLVHKLHEGVLDVRVPNWGSVVLAAFLETLVGDGAIPSGWFVTDTKNARLNPRTGEKTPALRHSAPVVPLDVWTLDEEAARGAGAAAAQGVAAAASAIGAWFAGTGEALLRRPTEEALLAVVLSALRLATMLDRPDVRDDLVRAGERLGAAGIA